MTKNKIFITGCAKTGTTLVRRLFNAFSLNVYNHQEISLGDFIKSDFEVGKRTGEHVFSNTLPPQVISHQLDLIKKNNIKVINITRNKTDTLNSSDGYVTEERYQSCINQASTYPEYITYTLDYKDLISTPDSVQIDLAQIFNLPIHFKWSDFPNWFDPHISCQEFKGVPWNSKEYRIRKIGESK